MSSSIMECLTFIASLSLRTSHPPPSVTHRGAVGREGKAVLARISLIMLRVNFKSRTIRFVGAHALILALALSGCAHFQPRPISPARSLAAYENRSLYRPGLDAFLAANHVPPPALGRRWDLKSLTLAAFYYQPSLAYARAQLLAAEAARITAAERPNPSLSVSPAHDSGIPGAPSPWIVPLGMDWPIETAGRRGDRMGVARHLAAAARWNLVGTVWEVRNRLRAALLALYAAYRSEVLLARQEAAQRTVLKLLEEQFKAGVVSSYELTQGRITLDRTMLARQAREGNIREARIALADAIGVPARALRHVEFAFSGFDEFPQDLTGPEVRREALLGRSDVRAALERYAASQSALKLEIARQWPNISLGPGYAWNAQLAGDNEWKLGLSVTLPVLNHNQGPIAEARARRRTAAARFIAIQSAAVGQIDGALAAYRSALTQLQTANALLSSLHRQLTAIREQVRAGERQPLDLATAEVTFYAAVQSRLAADLSAQRALGALEDAMQSPLTLSPSTVQSAQSESASTVP